MKTPVRKYGAHNMIARSIPPTEFLNGQRAGNQALFRGIVRHCLPSSVPQINASVVASGALLAPAPMAPRIQISWYVMVDKLTQCSKLTVAYQLPTLIVLCALVRALYGHQGSTTPPTFHRVRKNVVLFALLTLRYAKLRFYFLPRARRAKHASVSPVRSRRRRKCVYSKLYSRYRPPLYSPQQLSFL